MTHELKTWPVWFEMVRSGRKTFELRVNDRNYQCGDTLILREWEPETEIYTGSEERRVVADIIDFAPLYECVALVFMDDASDALSARVEELEGVVKTLLCSARPHPTEHPTMNEAWGIGRAALSSTPAQSLAKVKAEAIREAANKFEATQIEPSDGPAKDNYAGGHHDGQYAYVDWLMGEVSRLESKK